jgi:folate-dependent phosphoribosylglycinamide formyltransferase PurN
MRGPVDRFIEFIAKVKLVAVELTALAGFLLILGFVVYEEWRHLAALLR